MANVINNISYVIPCFNESPDCLIKTVTSIRNSMADIKELEYEIIVVDDGSTKFAYDMNLLQVKVIRNTVNMGYGKSLKVGIAYAKYEWIGIIDADGTYPANEFKTMMAYGSEYDMIIGKRNWSDIELMRRLPKYLLQIAASFFSGNNIDDLNSGMRIFRKNIVAKYIRYFPERFSFTTTLTMICIANAYRVTFVDIPYHVRVGKSYIHPVKDTLRFFSLVFRMALYFRPLRFFTSLSAIVFYLAVLRGIRDVCLNNFIGSLSLMLFMLSIQIFFFGLVAEIISKKD